jgi:DNA-binding CsgD family transcriptional regulator
MGTITQQATTRDACPRLSASLPRQDVIDTIGLAKRILAAESIPEPGDIHDLSAAKTALNSAWQAARRALDSGERGRGARAEPADLVCLLSRIRKDKNAVHALEVQQRNNSMRIAREALGRFRGIGRVDQLMDMCPKVMSALGFDRTMISTIEDTVWTPQAAYFAGDPGWAQEVVRTGRENPQRLTSAVPEHQLLRQARCILVSDPRNNEAVYKALVEPSRSRGYVAAAVSRDGKVIGFLHADCYFRDRVVDAFDLDVLDLFADGFGYILERATLLERGASIHVEVEKLTTGIAAAIDGFTGENADVGEAPWHHDPGALRPATERSQLTRREIEVLRLMAAGRGNSRIAELLVISPATVKSHVKHILRKLGVANRAEAVSCWFTGYDKESFPA